jgi:hypothetical protein
MPNVVRVPSLRMTEIDGSPDVQGVERIYLTNGYLSSLGGASVLLSMSGSGGTESLSYGARPAGGTVGRLFLPTDAYEIQRDNGVSWDSWGPIFKLTPPVDTDFFWINQGTATATTIGGTYLLAQAASGSNIKIRAKLVTAPYTITIEIEPNIYGVTNAGIGMTFADSSNKLHTCLLQHTGAVLQIYSAKWNSPTSFSASYPGSPIALQRCPRFLRLADDNANRIISWSNDGQNFQVFHTIGRTDFLTADRVGFFANADNPTVAAGVTVISWVQT